VSRATVLFLASIVVMLAVAHLLRDTPGFVVRAEDGSYQGDIVHYVYWTRLVTLGGIQAAYSGTWPETYAVYPPLPLYPYQAIGNLYRLFQDPTFDAEQAQQSLWLREAIKLSAVLWHLLTALAIYFVVRRAYGERAAGLTGSAYVLNPALLYDVAHWGQPDGAHSLFSVLAVGLLSWGSMALAALAKPQAWVLVPLLAVATLRERGVRGLARGFFIGGLVTLVVTLPFLLSGRLGELLSLPSTVGSVMPVVSADAHNFWWLVATTRGVDPLFTPDGTRLVGPLTYRLAAAMLVVAQFLMTYWLYWTRRVGLAEAAALGVLGWFVFTTQVHENHLFFALPLLALALPDRPSLPWIYGLLSVTLLLNMALHDQLLIEGFGSTLEDQWVVTVRSLNAGLNALCWLGWSLARISQHYVARQEPRSHPARRRAELQHTP
jgi:Gpi18-like mannosyltransferase